MTMRAKLIRFLPIVIGALLTAVVIYFSVVLFMTTDDGPARKKVIQQVTILTPPPPPPPPPKIEQPPEPEEQEEVDIPEPEEDIPDIPDAPPMGDDLGLDADGTAGSDAFGMIGRKGGRGLLDGDPNLMYAARLQRQIEELLIDNEQIRVKAYSVVAQLWIAQDGSITRAKLSRSTGDEDIDQALVEMLTGMDLLSQAPPQGMPQPVKLRISSRL